MLSVAYSNLIWHGDEFMDAFQAAAQAGQIAAAEHYRDRMAAILREHDNEEPSLPNNPPHGQSEMAFQRGMIPLADSIMVEVDEKTQDVYVYSSLEHALYLETGTSKMAPRPLWERTAGEEQNQMQAIAENVTQAYFEKYRVLD